MQLTNEPSSHPISRMFKTLFPNKLTDKIRLDFVCQLNINPQDFGERSEPLQKEVFTPGFLLPNIPQPAGFT